MIDFLDKDFIENPYPALEQLRAEGKPIWHEGVQMYLAARYEDANEVLRTKSLGRIFKPKDPEFEWDVFNWLHADSILDSEPPKHTRLRSLVAKAFNRNKIESQRPAIEKITNELLDAIEVKIHAGQTFDVIADYAEPLPVKVIAALLGFPQEDEYLLRPWSQSIVKMYEVNPTLEHQNEAKEAAREFADYVHGLMLDRKKNPGTDLISDLAAVEESGEKLSAHELVATCILLLNAGHEASVNAFGNGMVAALSRPDQAALLRTRAREIAESAVEEFLRFDAPLHLFERTATADTTIGGVIVKEGQKIASLLGSANRDEKIFERSNEMDLLRNPNPHIGFGAGIHFCLGGPLARLEMGISLPALFERFKDIELASTPKRRPTFVLRGYESVEISAARG
ncbi:unspecific monooxygenase [Candidatus Planktophila limnetica]|uniref:Unspecific monooxygenase n=1 Tax=Candidatus Planktophila limnetica TaxID=573600 RepID=A0A249LE42_9ACTN|nr:cytochrome P450 [Candidatus Planktophila limnetica]ASY27372.1 unspecific monooxygenase [Candidatus Planktophila limnetica]